jgi:hypothetical protein
VPKKPTAGGVKKPTAGGVKKPTAGGVKKPTAGGVTKTIAKKKPAPKKPTPKKLPEQISQLFTSSVEGYFKEIDSEDPLLTTLLVSVKCEVPAPHLS